MRYRTSCVQSLAPRILDMVDEAREITRQTFLRYVDPEDLADLAETLGYARHHSQGMTLASEGYVRYYKSVYQGRPCVYMDHSATEYIFY